MQAADRSHSAGTLSQGVGGTVGAMKRVVGVGGKVGAMKRVVGCCVAAAGVALAGCASTPTPPPEPPLYLDNGRGSQFGNYSAHAMGETRGAAGERCVTFDWDRPVSSGFAVRYTSESCESKERPGWMVARQLSRRLIPLSESRIIK